MDLSDHSSDDEDYDPTRDEEKDLVEEGDSEVAVRPPDDDATLLAQHPEGVGPREGQSVKPAPSDEDQTVVRVAVSVQRAVGVGACGEVFHGNWRGVDVAMAAGMALLSPPPLLPSEALP